MFGIIALVETQTYQRYTIVFAALGPHLVVEAEMDSLCSQKLNHSEVESEIVIIQAFDTCPMISLCDY